MRDAAIAILTLAACFTLEVFLFSIGWNLAVHPLFGMQKIAIVESLGMVLFLKICRMQILPVRARPNEAP